MSGSKANTSEKFAGQAFDRSKAAFAVGLPLYQQGVGMTREAIASGGQPAYLRQALAAALSNAGDASYLDAGQEGTAQALGQKGVIQGGNTGAVLSPQNYGAKFAQFVANSRSSQEAARIGQMLDAAGVGVGQAGFAGDSQLKSLSNQLGAISMRPNVDPTYATVVGGLSAAASIYGGGQQAGWWGQSAQTKALPQSRSYSSLVMPQSSGTWINPSPATGGSWA